MNWTDVPDCDVPLIVIKTEVWPAWRMALADLKRTKVRFSEFLPEVFFSTWMEVFMESVIGIHGAYSVPQSPDMKPYIFQIVFEEGEFQRLPKSSEPYEFSYLGQLLDHIISRFSKLLRAVCPVGGLQLWSDEQWKEFDQSFLVGDRLPHIDYHQYLGSDLWREKATMAKENAGQRCQVCNGTYRLEAHHRTYERLGFEDRDDITVLCRDCHQVFHDNGRLITHES